MILRFIDSTVLNNKWTVQKLNNIDSTHLVVLQKIKEMHFDVIVSLLSHED